MQFSERWLRTLCDPSIGSDELAHLLTMSGLEVEACDPVAPAFSGVVVGEVREVAKHPNADRLRLCKVDAGTGELLSIVCGAPNVAEGMKVPTALIGARLPGTGDVVEIRAATMRGVESRGMLCSARELGLSEDHSGLLALSPEAKIGSDVRDALALDDRLFTLKLTPNRADCLSLLGVAREVAALTGSPLRPVPTDPVPATIDATFPIAISAADGCGRFAGRVIRNVNPSAPTPAWMKERLERSGQRSISALVDITNYVMLELGRPLHVYDLDKLRGGIDVRWGRSGEKLKLLNDQTVDVDGTVLCIADASGPIGLAGIMGGDSTKAGDATRNILLESAFFFPNAIAGRARRFNFSSDASHRFERGVDYDNNLAGIERATRLVLDICGGQAGPVSDVLARLPERRPVRMRAERARKVIGVPIATAEMQSIFTRLGLASTLDEDSFSVTPPSWRFDIQIEEDLIEEVARVYGFDRIPAHPPVARVVARARPEGTRSLHALRHALAAADYREVINFSFVEAEWEADFAGETRPIRLLNPIASQLAVMRTSLVGGLVAAVRYNLNRKLPRVRLFEVGRVFVRDASSTAGELDVAGIRQPMRIGAIAYGAALDEQWGTAARPVDFYDAKGDIEALLHPQDARFEPVGAAQAHPALHPGRSARVVVDGLCIGWLGELHPRWQQKYELPFAPVLFELEAAPMQRVPVPEYHEVSKFPPVVRDMAVVVPEATPYQALLDALLEEAPEAVQAIRLFDVYRGKGVEPGRKSLAFRVVMQHTARTMTDAEADAAMAKLTQVLPRFGGNLRG